jgi:hypothetical protein
MAFGTSVTARTVKGNKRFVYGAFTNAGGSTGGDVLTGLSKVESFIIQHTGAAVVANAPVVNETFPLINSTGAVTIVTDADKGGIWEAFGI